MATEHTRLIYMTTGVLLQKLVSAKCLTEFSHIFVDEVNIVLIVHVKWYLKIYICVFWPDHKYFFFLSTRCLLNLIFLHIIYLWVRWTYYIQAHHILFCWTYLLHYICNVFCHLHSVLVLSLNLCILFSKKWCLIIGTRWSHLTTLPLPQVHERTEEMDFLLLVLRKLLNSNSRYVKVITTSE